MTPGTDLPSLSFTSTRIGRADRVEIPHVMGDVLEVADIFAGVEIDRYERVRIEIVAGPDRAVEVRRRIADHEVDALGLEVDRRILPHAAAERLVGVAGLGELRLLGRDVAMHVLAGGVLGRPHADGVLGDGVEVPDELAGLGVVGPHEAADTVLAAIGADQDFAVHGGRRHGLAIAERRDRRSWSATRGCRSWRRARRAWSRAWPYRPCRHRWRRRDCSGRSNRS